MNWNDYYIEQAGVADYNTFKGSEYQRGYIKKVQDPF